VLLARVVVRPLFDLIAAGRNEEVFTAMALLVALAAGWATGHVGLSLTLGAFLGGMIIAETPYRPVIQSEIGPFRGLFLSFFFISVGLSLDLGVLASEWPAVIGVTVVLVAAKIVTNAAASLVFRWSVPGSTQLGFLLAQGSEFAFVVLSLPPVRALVGNAQASVIVAAVALSLAATPTLAEAGRALAGLLRLRARKSHDVELQPHDIASPVLLAGMGMIGRTLADALTEFGIGYIAIERDQRRLAQAVADGYIAAFGDIADPRLWEPVAMHGRQISVITAPSFATASEVVPVVRLLYPDLKQFAVVVEGSEAERFRELGMRAVVDRSVPPGLDLAVAVLTELGLDEQAIGSWMRRYQARALASSGKDLAA